MKKSQLWFIKKGPLCFPSSWQGYIAFIIYIILMFAGLQNLDHEAGKNFFFMFIFTLILLYIAYKKGDKRIWIIPTWR